MAGTCSIKVDRVRGVVRTTLAGFFTLEDVERYEIERNRALDRLGRPPNAHLTLCDVSACLLSTPEVVAALQRVIGDPRYRSLRCAMVVPGTLARLQARRTVQRADVAMFDTVAAAERWLLEVPSDRRVAA